MTGKNAGTHAAAFTSGVDAIGSFTLKQSSHTQRDHNDLEDIERTNPNAAKLSSTIENNKNGQNGLSHLEVTDRLYNKK